MNKQVKISEQNVWPTATCAFVLFQQRTRVCTLCALFLMKNSIFLSFSVLFDGKQYLIGISVLRSLYWILASYVLVVPLGNRSGSFLLRWTGEATPVDKAQITACLESTFLKNWKLLREWLDRDEQIIGFEFVWWFTSVCMFYSFDGLKGKSCSLKITKDLSALHAFYLFIASYSLPIQFSVTLLTTFCSS